jgi:hypothetical protein
MTKQVASYRLHAENDDQCKGKRSGRSILGKPHELAGVALFPATCPISERGVVDFPGICQQACLLEMINWPRRDQI